MDSGGEEKLLFAVPKNKPETIKENFKMPLKDAKMKLPEDSLDIRDSSGEEKIISVLKSKIKPETTKEILKMSFKDAKTKLPEDSLVLVNDVIRCLILEAALRSGKQAVADHRTTIELEQIEKILPQLMLDFP